MKVPHAPISRPLAPCGGGRVRGFTLIELLVTFAVIAILLAVGIPSFGRLIASTKLSNAANDLVGGLNLSRSEAIRRGQNVTLRATSTATPGNLHLGWQIITDANGDGAAASPVTGADGTEIRSTAIQSGGTQILRVTRSGSGPFTYAASTATDRGYVVFSSRGAYESAPAYFRVCDANNPTAPGRVVQVSVMGKVSIDNIAIVCP